MNKPLTPLSDLQPNTSMCTKFSEAVQVQRFAVTLGLACLLTLQGAATALADNNYAATNRLTAVWEAHGNVLATTSYGMFRASRAEKKWVQLSPPASMPLRGSFAPVPTNASYVVFVAATGDSNKVAGIYISHDEGSSWKLLSKDHAFTSCYVTENGTIYALAARQVLVSTNSGNSWRDITAGVGGIQIASILPDPDHANLVCLRGWCIRGYILQAEDDRFEWKATRDWEWKQDQPNDDHFFSRGYATTWILHNFFATLENYFNYDFGGHVETGAFRIRTDQSSYAFESQKPKPIQVKVVFYPTDTPVKFVDLDQGAEFWGIKVKTPNTNYVHQVADEFEPNRSADAKSQAGKQLRKRPDFRIHDLQSEKPYQRTLDLDQLFKFDRKGRYKVQLSYDSMWAADRKLEEWPGYFTGAVFDVVIQ